MVYKLDTENQVFFYEQEFYVLSNFSSFHLTWEGLDFDTSEAAYQFEKFNYTSLNPAISSATLKSVRDTIKNSKSAHNAYKQAQFFKNQRNPNWDLIKVPTMKRILELKIDQHSYVKDKLLQTGNRLLIEDSWRDDFWGIGPNKDGQNMLGKLWMEVRENLREEIKNFPKFKLFHNDM